MVTLYNQWVFENVLTEPFIKHNALSAHPTAATCCSSCSTAAAAASKRAAAAKSFLSVHLRFGAGMMSEIIFKKHQQEKERSRQLTAGGLLERRGECKPYIHAEFKSSLL